MDHFWRASDVRRKYLGNERTTFIIDADVLIAEVLRKIKPADRGERALAEV
jgi:peroxiredoxin